ncbi:MAG: hypothetical protein K8I00_03440, partial [Candidatus Omnitrophica bacterium]|nr:hypothetical protein [Candidatus Omnitrophota bacterium]
MLQLFANKTFASLRRGIALGIVSVFLMGSVTPPAMAQMPPAVLLPQVGTLVGTTLAYRPPLMLGLTVHPENPLQFDFIIDGGDANLPAPDLSAESTKLINYFLTALTLPENQLWVNLSPYEKDRVIPDSLARTEMGRDML